MDLDARPTVGDSGLVGQKLGTQGSHVCVADAGLVDGYGGSLDRAPGQLGAHGHVGAQVLDGLEAADGTTELPALLGVFDGQIGGPRGQADLECGGEHGAVPPPPGGDVRTGDGDALGEGGQVHTGVSGSMGRFLSAASASRAAGSSEVIPLADRTSRTSRSARCSMTVGTAGRAGGGLDQPDHHRSVVSPVDQSGRQVGGHQRPRHQRPPQLLEDQHRLGQPLAHAAGFLGQAQAEHAGLAQLPPAVAVDHPVGQLEGADAARGGTRPCTAAACRRPGRPATR